MGWIYETYHKGELMIFLICILVFIVGYFIGFADSTSSYYAKAKNKTPIIINGKVYILKEQEVTDANGN